MILDNPLALELYKLLRAEDIGGNETTLNFDDAPDGYLKADITSASTDKLGVILARLSRPDELDDPQSLSRRITFPERPGRWRYELTLGRYNTEDGNRDLVFRVTIFLPFSDLPEVVSRLRA